MVVISVIAVLVALAALGVRGAKSAYLDVLCLNNLKNVGLAFRIYAADNHECFPWNLSTNGEIKRLELADHNFLTPFQIASNELSTPMILRCSKDKTGTWAIDWSGLTPTNVSYFLNLNSTQNEGSSIMAGDSNLLLDGAPIRSRIALVGPTTAVSFDRSRHKRDGNLLKADGSVARSTSDQASAALKGAAISAP